MSELTFDLHSPRAHKARLGRRLGKLWTFLVATTASATILGGAAFFVGQPAAAWLLFAIASSCLVVMLWYRYDLRTLEPVGPSLGDRLSLNVLAALNPRQTLDYKTLHHALEQDWQTLFITNRFLLSPKTVEQLLDAAPPDLQKVWQTATELADKNDNRTIEAGHVTAALMLNCEPVMLLLTKAKHKPEDVHEVIAWLDRALVELRRPRPFFGGIGRDWANGFTPQLNNYGHNISLMIEYGGGGFESLSNSQGVVAIKNALEQRASTIALIGENGIGKTSTVYALAQALLKEDTSRILSHNQIIELNSSLILSDARGRGALERTVVGLLNEASHAGHIVLFLDNAQVFLQAGTGSFDMSQILLPFVEAGRTPVIMAMTPFEYQHLKSTNPGFASLLTPVVLTEPDEAATLRSLEDTAVRLESQHHVLVTYESLKEAIRLSGRYDQDNAYPGKAIKLLEQAIPYADDHIVNAQAVQQAIEKTHGVKVQSAAPAESDVLLHLEDKIHERMVNQTHAVKAIASALRRARAGVSNPRRPIGSFMFLGPTGVGKTELAKAIAATYFSNESSMIRLDMSEYQQPSDVERLLSNGSEGAQSLIVAVRQRPFSVVLLDEIEKAHPNVLNLLLQLLDEGQLTDTAGRRTSFKDCIVIATSNAGANTIRERVQKGETLESFADEFSDELINSGQFKPELLNRFDDIVLFRPLNEQELGQVVKLMLGGINQTLAIQNISVELTDEAVAKVVTLGNDPRLGARPIRRALQRAVEDSIAGRILRGEMKAGDHVRLDVGDLSL
jgi:ATP-dependent Clp protease ATP-binding subunit ClpC